MRVFIGAVLLTACLVTGASAQQTIGPIAITNRVNGIPITVSATSWITVSSADNEHTVDTRIFVDLIDLQRKLPDVLDKSGASTADCSKRDSDNRSSGVSLKTGSLVPVDDQLIMSIRGNVDVWSCRTTPAKSTIAWKKHKIGFLNIKLPVRQTVKAATKRTKNGSQPFRENLPIQLVQKNGASVAPKIADSEIRLEGQDAAVTNANLTHAQTAISQKIFAAIQSAINFVKLKEMLPKELQKSTVVSTRFRSQGGHAIAEIILAATNVPNTQ